MTSNDSIFRDHKIIPPRRRGEAIDWAQRYGARRLDYATWDTEKLNRACDSDATVVALWLADSEREPDKEFYARTGAAWVAKFHAELMRRINEEFAKEKPAPRDLKAGPYELCGVKRQRGNGGPCAKIAGHVGRHHDGVKAWGRL